MCHKMTAILRQTPRFQATLSSSPKMTAKLNKVVEILYPDEEDFELENLEVTPTKEQQKFKSEKYGYDEVTIEAIPDEYIIPVLEDLEVVPTKQEQSFVSSKDGYNNVLVKPIPKEYIIPRGIKDILTNGIHNVSEYESVNVGVNLESWKEAFISSIDNTSGANVKRLPEGMKDIGYYAFAYCENLNLEELPSGLKTIAGYSFRSCTSLDLEELPNSVETIGSTAFRGCTNLALKKLPDNLKTMGTYAFAECPKLAITEIPKGVTLLDQYLFYQSTGIEKMILHEDIQTLNQRVFYDCTNLREVDVQNPNITSLAGYTFYDCTSLVTLIVRAKKPPTITTTTFTNTPIAKNTDGFVYVPDESVDDYQKATNWSRYASRIKPLSEYKGELLI